MFREAFFFFLSFLTLDHGHASIRCAVLTATSFSPGPHPWSAGVSPFLSFPRRGSWRLAWSCPKAVCRVGVP